MKDVPEKKLTWEAISKFDESDQNIVRRARMRELLTVVERSPISSQPSDNIAVKIFQEFDQKLMKIAKKYQDLSADATAKEQLDALSTFNKEVREAGKETKGELVKNNITVNELPVVKELPDKGLFDLFLINFVYPLRALFSKVEPSPAPKEVEMKSRDTTDMAVEEYQKRIQEMQGNVHPRSHELKEYNRLVRTAAQDEEQAPRRAPGQS